MRRTNADFKDRSVTVNLTREMADVYADDFEEFKEAVRENARALENSINGVVAVASNEHVVNVRCIHGKDADADMVRRLVQELQAKTLRQLDDE